MVSVYALLCAATLLRSDCTPATAIDVVRMPDADNEMSCLRDAMTTLAQLAIQPESGEYWKVVCAHDSAPPSNYAVSPPEAPPSIEAPPTHATNADEHRAD